MHSTIGGALGYDRNRPKAADWRLCLAACPNQMKVVRVNIVLAWQHAERSSSGNPASDWMRISHKEPMNFDQKRRALCNQDLASGLLALPALRWQWSCV